MNRTHELVVELPRRQEGEPVSDFDRLLDDIETEERARREAAKPKPVPVERRQQRPFAYD